MRIDIKRITGPVEQYYDKFIALSVLIVLISSVLILGVRVAVAGKDRIARLAHVEKLQPLKPPVVPIDRRAFEDGLTKIRIPDRLDPAAWNIQLLVPEQRIVCEKCVKPIAAGAKKCPFCDHVPGVTPPDQDTDGDGMPDWWEVKYGLDPRDRDDANLDTDKDGYSNLEEYLSLKLYGVESNPKDSKSIPPVFTFNKLVVKDTSALTFKLKFMSAMKMSGGQYKFAINHVDTGQTYWKVMGEEVLGFKVIKYEEKFVDSGDKSIGGGRKEDVSELTLESGGASVVLVKLKERRHWEKSAVLLYKPDNLEIPVREGVGFEIRGQKCLVKEIDAAAKTVLIVHLPLNREVAIGKLGLVRDGAADAGPAKVGPKKE